MVATFHEHVGLGAIALDDGREVSFHSTQLTDGTRRIEVGARVVARVRVRRVLVRIARLRLSGPP